MALCSHLSKAQGQDATTVTGVIALVGCSDVSWTQVTGQGAVSLAAGLHSECFREHQWMARVPVYVQLAVHC